VRHRARAGGDRDRHQLTNSPTNQLTNSLLFRGRRRRDGAAGAPSSGSRVSPLPIAPCHAGRRRSTVLLYCCSSRTIGCQSALSFASTRSASSSSSVLHRIPMVRRETPHLAHGAGGASSYRSVRGLARGARALPPTTWILHHFHLDRAVGCPTCSSWLTFLRFPSARPASCATGRAHVASSHRVRSRWRTHRPRSRRGARASSRQTGTCR